MSGGKIIASKGFAQVVSIGIVGRSLFLKIDILKTTWRRYWIFLRVANVDNTFVKILPGVDNFVCLDFASLNHGIDGRLQAM